MKATYLVVFFDGTTQHIQALDFADVQSQIEKTRWGRIKSIDYFETI